jgi:hypothetical protein
MSKKPIYADDYIKDYLQYHYVSLSRPASAIAKELTVSQKTIRNYIEKFNLTRKETKK